LGPGHAGRQPGWRVIVGTAECTDHIGDAAAAVVGKQWNGGAGGSCRYARAGTSCCARRTWRAGCRCRLACACHPDQPTTSSDERGARRRLGRSAARGGPPIQTALVQSRCPGTAYRRSTLDEGVSCCLGSSPSPSLLRRTDAWAPRTPETGVERHRLSWQRLSERLSNHRASVSSQPLKGLAAPSAHRTECPQDRVPRTKCPVEHLPHPLDSHSHERSHKVVPTTLKCDL